MVVGAQYQQIARNIVRGIAINVVDSKIDCVHAPWERAYARRFGHQVLLQRMTNWYAMLCHHIQGWQCALKSQLPEVSGSALI